MSDFGAQVEYAAAPLPKVWRLVAFSVPDRFDGLMVRLGFRPTKKNPANWWRLFDHRRAADRPFAEKVLEDLKQAGIASSWTEVDLPASQNVPKPGARAPKRVARSIPRPQPTQSPEFAAALARKAVPGTTTGDREVGRLKKAAARWLEKNDKHARKDRKAAKRKDRAAAEQAKRNPALVARYRSALLGR